mmetsp:Transcript_6539/g.13615  ORF Transcript_6539/g.13615 Transcript_6539/m.13615 type:complete len:107 (+) Transcript_6539:1516-1836(+)
MILEVASMAAALTDASSTVKSNSSGCNSKCKYSTPPKCFSVISGIDSLSFNSTKSSSSIESLKNGRSSSRVRSGPKPKLMSPIKHALDTLFSNDSDLNPSITSASL